MWVSVGAVYCHACSITISFRTLCFEIWYEWQTTFHHTTSMAYTGTEFFVSLHEMYKNACKFPYRLIGLTSERSVSSRLFFLFPPAPRTDLEMNIADVSLIHRRYGRRGRPLNCLDAFCIISLSRVLRSLIAWDDLVASLVQK